MSSQQQKVLANPLKERSRLKRQLQHQRKHCKIEIVEDTSSDRPRKSVRRKNPRMLKIRRTRNRQQRVKVVNTVVMCYLEKDGYRIVPHVHISNRKVREGQRAGLYEEAKEEGTRLSKQLLDSVKTLPTQSIPFQFSPVVFMHQPVNPYPPVMVPQFMQIPQLQ